MKRATPNEAFSLILDLAGDAITADRLGKRESVEALMRTATKMYKRLTGEKMDEEVIRPALERAMSGLRADAEARPWNRMKWMRDGLDQKSADGRFVIGGSIWTCDGNGCYIRLRDNLTGKEYPCRTEASAKTAARNLARQGAVT